MENLIISLNAVVPFVIYIAFGYFCRAVKIADEATLKKVNQIVFKAFFPFVTFGNIYSAGQDLVIDGGFIAIVLGVLGVTLAAIWLIVPRIVPENARRGVIIQALYRSNMVLFAIPLTQNLFGAEALALTSVVVTVIVPTYNVIAVVLLEYYRGGKVEPLSLVKKVLTNPLIDGAIVGLIFHFLNLRLPTCVSNPISAITSMATPLALFVLGGTLKFSSVQKNLKIICSVVFTKLVVLPAVAIGIARVLGLSGMQMFILFAMMATPTAVSSYTMAQNMGGDGDLAGELVMTTTVVSVFTLFLYIFGLKTLGWI